MILYSRGESFHFIKFIFYIYPPAISVLLIIFICRSTGFIRVSQFSKSSLGCPKILTFK